MPLPKKPYNPARYLIGGFLVLILLGSLLLFLPAATRSGGIAYIDALFTATSAVCLTGLVVVDTGTFFTPFGQAVIMLLIFTGTLGFTTMATLAFIFWGDDLFARSPDGQRSAQSGINDRLIPLLKAIVFMIVLCELAGAALLSLRFYRKSAGHRVFLPFSMLFRHSVMPVLIYSAILTASPVSRPITWSTLSFWFFYPGRTRVHGYF